MRFALTTDINLASVLHYPQLVTRTPQSLTRYAFAFTGKMAFSGQIWAQTAQPVHRLASILTLSFQI